MIFLLLKIRCFMKVFSIIFSYKNGVTHAIDRHDDYWIRLFENYYGRLIKVRDNNKFIKTVNMMKLVELR